MQTSLERFWAKVQKADGCWNWTAAVDGHGYAKFVVRPKWWKASRFIWTQLNGEIPEGACVCHRCDNPRCVRPDHLFLGTQQDNMSDMIQKRRHKFGRFPGESNPNARLLDSEITEIREKYKTGEFKQVDLAEEYGVTQAHISWLIRRGR